MNEEKVLDLIKLYPKINFEKIEHRILYDDEDDTDFHYNVKGFKGNENLTFSVASDERTQTLESILQSNFEFIPDFFAVNNNGIIEILLRPITTRSSFMLRRRFREGPIEILMDYYSNSLKILIEDDIGDKNLLSQLAILKQRTPKTYVFKISGLKRNNEDNISEDLRKILNCIIFDFTYNFETPLEILSLDNFIRIEPRRRKRNLVSKDIMNITYKDYVPELIEYFYIGEKVDYAPFRFICYFHIIEYFSDKSAYFLAANKLKSIMLKPDFHIKTDKYVNQAINFFKTESTKFTGDKVKIRRVFNQFIDKDEFAEYLKEIELFEYFTTECIIKCHKDLKLPPLDFSSASKFEESLTKRIYSMRCSIVHSNPDFDETKAIPFKPTPDNMNKLRKENEMIYGIARQIILESNQIK
jgi:hypothetical protein